MKYVFFVILIFFIICTLPVMGSVPKDKMIITLQIPSDNYVKQPYVHVPTAWISPKTKIRLFKTCQTILPPKWKIVEPRTMKTSWYKSLKCHPAVTLKVINANKKKTKKFFLLIYPRSYRALIEDPIMQKTLPLPVCYLGRRKQLIYYCYPKKITNPPILKMIAKLKLKKRR